jgi:hypothetical protein
MVNSFHLNGMKKFTIAVDITENKLKTHIKKFYTRKKPRNITSTAQKRLHSENT